MKKILFEILLVLSLVACGNFDQNYKTIGDIPNNLNLEVTSIGININNGGSYLVIKTDNKYGLLEASKEDLFGLGDNYKRVLSSDFTNNKLKFIRWENDLSKLDEWAKKENIVLEEIIASTNTENSTFYNTNVSNNEEEKVVKMDEITELRNKTLDGLLISSFLDKGVYTVESLDVFVNSKGKILVLMKAENGEYFATENPVSYGSEHIEEWEEYFENGTDFETIIPIIYLSGTIYKEKTFNSLDGLKNYLINDGFVAAN